jgi:tricorn protease
MRSHTRLVMLLVVILLTLPVLTQANPAYIARHPALSPDGSQVAFSWRGDIWVASTKPGSRSGRRLTDNLAGESSPSWSPDGTEIAFSSNRNGNDDIFVVPTSGGAPERLTWHSDWETMYGWSPDGQTLYFSADRESRMDLVYAVSRQGGRPVRVIGDLAFNAAVSPDGKWIAYVRGYTEWWRKHYRGPASRDIWVRAIGGGVSHHVVAWQGDDDHPRWSADSGSLFFQSERRDGVKNLWRQELKFDGDRVDPAASPTQITHLQGDGMQFLNLSRDGKWAVWESDGWLWIAATADGVPRKLTIDCPGDPKTNPASRRILTGGATEFTFAPGEKQVAFVVQGEIYVAPVKDDELQDPVRVTFTDAREKDLAWLDENRLLYVSDRHGNDDIFMLKSTADDEERLGRSRYRQETRLTDSAETEYAPQVSPDGETILYRRHLGYMWTMKPDGGEQKQVVTQPKILHASWSPDSRYVAVSYSNHGSFEDIFICDLQSDREPVNVSNHPNDDWRPLWSADGKRLSWASRKDGGEYNIRYLWLTELEAGKSTTEREREEELQDEEKGKDGDKDEESPSDEADKGPEPVKIDWFDFADRIRTVTTVRGGYWDYDQSPDGKHYTFRSNSIEDLDLWAVDWDGDNQRRLTTGGVNPDHLSWREDSELICYISGGKIRQIENKGGASATTLGFSVEITVDAQARRLQKFHEAWRLLNDGFYDENFHGADWDAIRERYEPQALAATEYTDFKTILQRMIGELNASHLGVWGGPSPRTGHDRTGRLGFRPADDYAGEGIKVAWVLPRGPLDREGKRVETGEIILAINGRTIAAGENYYQLLNHKAGKEIDLLIRSAKGDERTITIEPAGSVWWLAYRNWMDENRALVDTLSDGRLGYVHMSAMGDGNWEPFLADLFSRARGKEGLILDIRYNNGGHIHDDVLTFLSRRIYGYSINRGRDKGTFDARDRWDKPIVLLINERSYSDGEIFPWGFKELGLGLMVGMPTFGAVIGTSNVQLIDGTTFRIPSTGWYRVVDGKIGANLENNPVTPHVMVPDVPEENLQGRDAQIERSVAECLDMLSSD